MTGFTVALIGCDGAGKTTVARALESVDARVRYLYMGVSADSSNRQLPTTRLAHAVKRSRPASREPQPPASLARRMRKAVRSALRLANRLAEEWYRQLVAMAYLARGRIVVFDRHFLADYYTADVAASARTRSQRLHGLLLARVYPRPAVVILLDAAPEVLFGRKGEGTVASLTRRRAEYLRFGPTLAAFTVVDADRPVEAVVADVARIMREHEARAR
jgi:thymidylate kinase